MTSRIKTRRTRDASGKEIQHSIFDTGHSFQIHRWEEASQTNTLMDEITYHGLTDKRAARTMATGSLNSLHHQTIHETRGDTYTDNHGITWHWSDSLGHYITIPED